MPHTKKPFTQPKPARTLTKTSMNTSTATPSIITQANSTQNRSRLQVNPPRDRRKTIRSCFLARPARRDPQALRVRNLHRAILPALAAAIRARAFSGRSAVADAIVAATIAAVIVVETVAAIAEVTAE